MEKLRLPEDYKYISAFLTFRCNLNCSFCLNAFDKTFDRKRDEISGEKWILGLNRIVSRPDVPVTFSGGEPTLHRDFFYILNNLKPELSVDLLTNLQWSENTLGIFLKTIDPKRLSRGSKYPSIRVSYHPEQMKDGEKLVKNAKRLQDAGFSIGIYGVQYPSSEQLESLTRMQFRCRDLGLDFRIKDFTGIYSGKDNQGKEFSITYGNYSKYPGSAFQTNTRDCLCKTSELLIGPNGNVYKCHRDVFAEEFSIGNLCDEDFKIESNFRKCSKYGQCHPCDVKVKTDFQQKLGHTSVEIKNIE
jgi:MoaA/NifB/PqqE/SkfB family radical SAM enzyme